MYGLCVKNASKDNYKLHTGGAKLFHISVEIGINGYYSFISSQV